MTRNYIVLHRAGDRSTDLYVAAEFSQDACLNLLRKFHRFLKMRHALSVLEDIAKIVDDRYLSDSPKQTAAFQLLQMVFAASGYELTTCQEAE